MPNLLDHCRFVVDFLSFTLGIGNRSLSCELLGRNVLPNGVFSLIEVVFGLGIKAWLVLG